MAQHAKIGLGHLAGRRIGDPHGDHRRAEVARGSRELTLCCSRYAFLASTLRQDLVAVLEGLEAAWAFFGVLSAASRRQSHPRGHPARSLHAGLEPEHHRRKPGRVPRQLLEMRHLLIPISHSSAPELEL
ncbi:MAG: hypothetical protein M3N56_16325, partial [Actinomycetota bacterium]|nr:hypothetical protein [Actinomycetota bacterium]